MDEIAMAGPVSSLCFTSAGIGIVLCLCVLVILSPLVLALLRLSFFQSQSAERYIESERYRGHISYSPSSIKASVLTLQYDQKHGKTVVVPALRHYPQCHHAKLRF